MQQVLFHNKTPRHINNMPMRTNKLYRDSIFKDIELTPLAIDIIDTPEFQRLDGIQQLGFASLVYRNAKHTRFNHSIGIYHESKNMIRQIRNNHNRFNLPMPEKILKGIKSNNEEEKFNTLIEIIAIAALLHDITHIPSGHALEDELRGLYKKHDDIESLRLWNFLYDENSNICKIFQNNEYQYLPSISNNDLRDLIFLILKYKYNPNEKIYKPFEKILQEKNKDSPPDKKYAEMIVKLEGIYSKFTSEETLMFEPFMSEIISNTISADLLEYLKRDVWGTGLDHSVDSRIEKYFIIKKDGITKKKHLVIKLHGEKGIRLDTISAIIELMELRYALAEKVYYHKTKVSADVMLGKLLTIIGEPPDSNPYTMESDDYSINTMTESDLYTYIKEKAKSENNSLAEELLSLIQYRKLYKPGIIIPKNLLSTPEFEKLYELFRKGDKPDKNIRDFEENINSIFNDDKVHVMLFCPPRKPQSKEIGVFVEDEDVFPLSRTIEGETNIPVPQIKRIENLNEMYNLLWKFFVFIHPEDYKNELTHNAIIVKFCQVLKEYIEPLTLNEKILWHKKYTINFDSPEDIFEKWRNNNIWPNAPDGRIRDQMEELINDEKLWVENIMKVKNEINNFNDFLDHLYVQKLKEYYSNEGYTIDITTENFVGNVISSIETRMKKGKIPPEILNMPHYKELYVNNAITNSP